MPRKKKLSDNDQKQLLLLKATYEMHAKTLEEASLRGKKESVERISILINDVVAQMSRIDADFTKKCIDDFNKSNKRVDIASIIQNADESASLFDKIGELGHDGANAIQDSGMDDTQAFYDMLNSTGDDIYSLADKIDEGKDEPIIDSFSQSVDLQKGDEKNLTQENAIFNNTDPNAQYDLIPLPSKGECYRVKVDKVPVGYLTASDENLITSPNLYESGQISSILLRKKILKKEIDVDSLVSGDVDAIMVFLRGTSYGSEFPIVATDPNTGKKIETTVDLSKLKYKPFMLKGDENGYFDYTLPRSGSVIKFKFLTKKEEMLLKKINKKENEGITSFELSDAVEKVRNAIKNDTTLSDSEKAIVIDANSKLEKWANQASKGNGEVPYTKTITNTMEMHIVSVNGDTDKKNIHNFVMNMPASDSLAFRRYIYDNQPGVDFEVEVQRPESMGGGSFKCFLEWDDYVFWHIA